MTVQEIYANYQIDAINDYNSAIKELEKIFNENKEKNVSELRDLLDSEGLRNSFLDKYSSILPTIVNGDGKIVSIDAELQKYISNLCSDIRNKPENLIKSLFDQ